MPGLNQLRSEELDLVVVLRAKCLDGRDLRSRKLNDGALDSYCTSVCENPGVDIVSEFGGVRAEMLTTGRRMQHLRGQIDPRRTV